MIISKLARAFTQTQWKKFSTHYLSLGSESIEAFMGPHNMEDAQLAAARLLTTWKNLNGIDVSVAKLQEILEIAEKEGMVEKGTSKLLQQSISKSCKIFIFVVKTKLSKRGIWLVRLA